MLVISKGCARECGEEQHPSFLDGGYNDEISKIQAVTIPFCIA